MSEVVLRYNVIVTPHVTELAVKVSEYVNDGWELHGELQMHAGNLAPRGKFPVNSFVFVQALFLPYATFIDGFKAGALK